MSKSKIMSVTLGSMVGVSGAISGLSAQTATSSADNTATPKTENLEVSGVRPLVNDKLPGGVQNAPQSIDVIPLATMRAEAVTRLEDALKNVPGITLNSGEGAARGDTVNLRGFSAFNDFYLDGIRDAAVYDRDSFNLESVEVLKGPSAVLFGRGSTGGVINQVSKAPTLAPLQFGTVSVGTNNALRATADVDQPIGPNAAFRLNAMDERSEVADRKDVLNRRWGIAPSLALGIGEPTSIVFSYLHQQENNRPDTGIPFLNGEPAPVPRNTYYGLSTNKFTAVDDIATMRASHVFNDWLTGNNTLRFANYQFNNIFDAPNFGNEILTNISPAKLFVGRDAPSSLGTQTNITNQTDLTGRFDTLGLGHVLAVGVELARQTSALGRYKNTFNANAINAVTATPLLNPNPAQNFGNQPVTSDQDTTAFSDAVYTTDTISFGKMVDLIAGLRFDRFAASYNQYNLTTSAVTHLDHTDHVLSPRVALVWKPAEAQRYYVSYGTSFDPSAEALTLTTKTANLAPVQAKTYEAGTKTQWLDGLLTVTAAVFHTAVSNAQTNDPDNPTITVLDGNQRVNGFELGASGYLTENWEILAGYTYLDAKTTASGTASQIGKFLPNAARNAANLFTEYTLNDDWKIGGGANWLGHRYADLNNTANIPGYVIFNAMAAYQLNDRINLQLNGTNLFNKVYYENSYYTSTAENHVIPGAGRSFTLTTSVNF